MNANTLIAIALAALLVFAGTAAAGSHADAPTDENATDAHQPEDAGADADDGQRDENASDAPPTEMPANASDQVSEIHALIQQHLDGTLEGSLGEHISALVSNSSDGADDASSDAADEARSEADDASEDARADAADDGSQADAGDQRSADADRAGPAGDLPAQAADHVSAVHDAISSFLSGDGDGSLGETVSGLGGGSAQG